MIMRIHVAVGRAFIYGENDEIVKNPFSCSRQGHSSPILSQIRRIFLCFNPGVSGGIYNYFEVGDQFRAAGGFLIILKKGQQISMYSVPFISSIVPSCHQCFQSIVYSNFSLPDSAPGE